MADQKISELTNITGANLANADEFVVVDVSADQTKAVTRAEFFKDTPLISVGQSGTEGGEIQFADTSGSFSWFVDVAGDETFRIRSSTAPNAFRITDSGNVSMSGDLTVNGGVISATSLIKTTNNGFEVSSDSSAHYWMRNAAGDARALMYRNATANELTLQAYRNSDGAARAILNIDPENENFTFVTGTANRLTVNSTGLNVSGRVDSSGYVVEGVGSGGVGLTHNDGYGNASVTFNHVAGTPEQDGASARITVNTDSASANAAQMDFQIKSSVTSGTAVGAVSKLIIAETKVTVADDLQVNGGVYLGGSVAANYMDDYELGNWTPVISDGTNNATSNVSVGTYVKTGNHVHVQGRVRLSSLGSVSGAIRLTGLPFAGVGPSNNFSAMTVGRAINLNLVAGTTIVGDLRTAATYVFLLVWDASLGTTNLQATEFSADGDISFSMDYIST